MATGGQDHVLRIWQVMTYEGYQAQEGQCIPLLCPKPYKEWHGVHHSDIFEINWSPKDPSSPILLSVSADCLVVIWSINFDKPIQILQHSDILCSALFMRPTSENYVASGCFDKMIRIWNVKQRKVIDW
jgi:WD40 repeat protein